MIFRTVGFLCLSVAAFAQVQPKAKIKFTRLERESASDIASAKRAFLDSCGDCLAWEDPSDFDIQAIVLGSTSIPNGTIIILKDRHVVTLGTIGPASWLAAWARAGEVARAKWAELSQKIAMEKVAESEPFSPVTRFSGGSIRTELSPEISLNRESSLSREWVSIHDNALPVDVLGTAGITTRFNSKEYLYSTEFTLITKEPVSAVELRFLLFDVWGNHIRTLSLTKIADVAVGKTALTGEWNLYSENEAMQYYASISYVARVRTSKGSVTEGNASTVIGEARKFSKKFSPQDLEPKPPQKGLTI